MKKLINLPNILIVILLGILIFQNLQSGKKPNIIRVEGKPYEVVKWVIDTQEVEKQIIVTKPGKIIVKDTIIYVEIPKIVDTLAILKDFYAKKVFTDTLKFPDSLGYVYLRDTISQNSIHHRQYKSVVKEKIITDTKIVKDLPKNQLFVGLDAQFSKSNFVNSVGAGFILKNKKEQIYNLGLGVTENKFSPYFRFGYYKKISFKK